jgi:hypothetical protein
VRALILIFVGNAFRDADANLLKDALRGYGLVPTLWSVVREGDDGLAGLALRCLANIAADSRAARDEVLGVVSPAAIVEICEQSVGSKTAKAAARLLRNCCRWPTGDGRGLFTAITHILADQRLRFLDPLLIFGLALLAEHSPDLILGDGLLLANLETRLRLEMADPKLPLALLHFLGRLVDLNAFPPESMFDRQVLLGLLNVVHIADEVLVAAMQLMSNLLAAQPEFARAFIGTTSQKTVPVDRIAEYADDDVGRHQLRVEALFLMANLVIEGSFNVVAPCVDRNFMRRFVDGLYLDDPGLVPALLCAMAKMTKISSIGISPARVKKQFEEANGYAALDAINEDSDTAVREMGMALEKILSREGDDGT